MQAAQALQATQIQEGIKTEVILFAQRKSEAQILLKNKDYQGARTKFTEAIGAMEVRCDVHVCIVCELWR